LGYLGEVSAEGLKRFDLRGRSTVAELKLDSLWKIANLVPRYSQPPVFPAVTRDLNLVVDESVAWADVLGTVRAAAAPFVEAVNFQDVYRDRERLGAGKKSLLFTLTLRSSEGTLRGEEVEAVAERVVAACQKAHGAQLRA
jgi:phenylalanyl-tRNA synthetase beta chain